MLKAIIFDLYETLITEFDPHWKPPRLSLADRLGISREDFEKHWSRLADKWEKGHYNSYQDLLLALCGAVGHTPSEPVIADLTEERFVRTGTLYEKIESSIVGMVQELRTRGFRLGVITNAGNIDTELWSNCQLAPFFEVFIPSFEVGTLKPDPEIFEHGLQALGVSAREAIFVGDGGRDELSGATRVGLRAFWATWYLDRWPLGIRPGGFKGDGWRQFPEGEPPFPRLHNPPDLLERVSNSVALP